MLLRGTRRGSSEIRVLLAKLLKAFGLSLRKTSGFFRVLSESVSKSCVEEWTRKVEEKLGFNPKPREYSVIAVDSWCSAVAKHCTCGSRRMRKRGGQSRPVFHSREQRRMR
jgi:hypothetical protein